jgi:hypothetical protein
VADDYGALECSVSENVIVVGVGINDVPNRLRRHLLAESFDIYSRSTPPSNFEIGSSSSRFIRLVSPHEGCRLPLMLWTLPGMTDWPKSTAMTCPLDPIPYALETDWLAGAA